MKQKKIPQYKHEKGYALLFALLFITVVLSVSLSILLISRKELILSTSAEDSQQAFYAADSAAECAFYWDFHNDNVDAGFSQKFSTSSATVQHIKCSKIVIRPTRANQGSIYSPYTFSFDYPVIYGHSAHVDVIKEYKTVTINGVQQQHLVTTIDARGYNIGNNNSPKKLERGIRVTY